MARWNIRCSNVVCTEFAQIEELECSMFDIPICSFCGNDRFLAPSRIHTSHCGAFPFTTTNVDGKPMTITSMHQLSQVERDYGVAFSAFNQANENDLSPLKSVPTFRGDEMRRK